MKIMILSFVVAVMAFTGGCTNKSLLGSKEMEKLDPALQKLLSEEMVADATYSVYQQTDGQKLYGVLIYGASRNEIQKLGIHVNSTFGDLITAKITPEQLKSVVQLGSVYSVKNSLKNVTQ